jgi:hypothetical protein
VKSGSAAYALLILLVSGLPAPLKAATCSCAGVPLLASIDTSAKEKGDLFINYILEYHAINDLVSGSDDVKDETGRDRNSLSQVLSASYAITDHWSVSALLSYVRHEREIGASFIGKTTTSGIGDSVVLARYSPLFFTPFSRHELFLGLGARIPTGDNDAGEGVVVSEDMQPGSGAWGEFFWTSYSYAFNQAATLQLNTSANYMVNQRNDRKYSFGDELNLAVGISQIIGTRFSYSAGFRYRSTKADERFGFEIPNTGGEWLDFIPAIQYSLSDNWDLGLSGRIPVWRDLNGVLQFTTSYSAALSVTYGF